MVAQVSQCLLEDRSGPSRKSVSRQPGMKLARGGRCRPFPSLPRASCEDSSIMSGCCPTRGTGRLARHFLQVGGMLRGRISPDPEGTGVETTDSKTRRSFDEAPLA